MLKAHVWLEGGSGLHTLQLVLAMWCAKGLPTTPPLMPASVIIADICMLKKKHVMNCHDCVKWTGSHPLFTLRTNAKKCQLVWWSVDEAQKVKGRGWVDSFLRGQFMHAISLMILYMDKQTKKHSHPIS